eukprot:4197558-Pleurochrysis_carterae.AAC.1
MTNWASLALPLSAVGDSLGSQVSSMLRAGQSLFGEDLALQQLIDSFSPVNPELAAKRIVQA